MNITSKCSILVEEKGCTSITHFRCNLSSPDSFFFFMLTSVAPLLRTLSDVIITSMFITVNTSGYVSDYLRRQAGTGGVTIGGFTDVGQGSMPLYWMNVCLTTLLSMHFTNTSTFSDSKRCVVDGAPPIDENRDRLITSCIKQDEMRKSTDL